MFSCPAEFLAMGDADDLDELLTLHRELRQKMPHAWNAFLRVSELFVQFSYRRFCRFCRARTFFVTAPTAGGKTEAVVAPICERIARNKWSGLSVLVVTPTRALVNDLYYRLVQPCEQMGIELGRKTADHALGDEISEQVLITTPESTESLLTFRREVFG